VEEQEALEEKPDEKIPASIWESGVQESIVESLTHLETLSNDAEGSRFGKSRPLD
jgi:hypothetical protein